MCLRHTKPWVGELCAWSKLEKAKALFDAHVLVGKYEEPSSLEARKPVPPRMAGIPQDIPPPSSSRLLIVEQG